MHLLSVRGRDYSATVILLMAPWVKQALTNGQVISSAKLSNVLFG